MSTPEEKLTRKFTVEPDVPVYCACDDFIYLDQFKPNPENPNTHPNDQVALLADILKEGWRLAITVSNQSGLVVKGHGRLLAARRGGLRGAPVDYQDYATPEAELQDMMADNQIAALSHRDPKKVKPLLIRLDKANVPLRLSGFRPMDLKKMFDDDDKPAKPEAQYAITADMNECYDYVVIFATNDMDDLYLRTFLGVEREESHKKTGLGTGRVVTFEKFMKQLIENKEKIPAPPSESANTKK